MTARSRLSRAILATALASGLFGCRPSSPAASSPSPPASAISTAEPPSTDNDVPGGRRAAIVMNLVSVDDAAVVGIHGGGVERFTRVPGPSLPPQLKGGSTLIADCVIARDGVWTIRSAKPHHGLPIAFGTVKARTPDTLTLDTPFGEAIFTIRPDSFVAPEAVPGAFASVKYYHVGTQATILNCLPMPGCMVEDGIVTGKDATSFALFSHRGTTTFAAAPKGLATLPVGTPVTFRYRVGEGGRIEPLSLEKVDGPFTFTGKRTESTRDARVLSVLDVVHGTGVTVDFTFDTPPPVLRDARPGDLLRVSYTLAEGKPRLVTVEKVPLRPVYFGRILQCGDGMVRLLTRQGQTRQARLDGETLIPVAVRVGDMADVIYRETPGQLPLATVVVKE